MTAGAPSQVDVFVAGEGGYHTYRIPSIIATPRGTLLAFAEARRAGAGRRRRHRSRAAAKPRRRRLVVADAGRRETTGPNTFGNPCPVIDSRTGIVWLLTTQNLGVDRERDIIAGTSQGTRTVWVMKSDDDGETWSAPVEITSSVKRPRLDVVRHGPRRRHPDRVRAAGDPGEPRGGRHRRCIARTCSSATTSGRALAARRERRAPAPTRARSSSFADGRLLLNMRNHPPKPENYRLVATSDDGGRTLFDRAARSPRSSSRRRRPASSACAMPAASSRRSAAVSPIRPARGASGMTVRLSEDEGASWAARARRARGARPPIRASGRFAGGASGLLYERGDRSPYETHHVRAVHHRLDSGRARTR